MRAVDRTSQDARFFLCTGDLWKAVRQTVFQLWSLVHSAKLASKHRAMFEAVRYADVGRTAKSAKKRKGRLLRKANMSSLN